MRKVIVDEFMSLDGVVQAPVEANEDRSGGFKHAGWHVPYIDDMFMKWVTANVAGAGGYLLGRRTYEIFAEHWPNAPKEEEALARPMNTLPKYVVSTTLSEPLEWQNSTLIKGDVAAVAAFKQEEGRDLHAIGSTKLVQALIEHDLVDEFRLMIDPVVLGGGKRLFHNDGALRSMRLVNSQVTTKGAILTTYARSDEASSASAPEKALAAAPGRTSVA